MKRQPKSGSLKRRSTTVSALDERRRQLREKQARAERLTLLLNEFLDAKRDGSEALMHRVGVKLASEFTKAEINARARTVEFERRNARAERAANQGLAEVVS